MFACLVSYARAQTESETIYGSVSDPTGAFVSSATIYLIDVDRGLKSEVATGSAGFYSFAGVHPGPYRIEVTKAGFKLERLTGLTLNVLDDIEQNFRLEVGPVSESATVQADAINVNTTDGTVSTLIDNRFVENLALNGRSFSGLIDLTLGVGLVPNNFFEEGQFSVNGQRPDANYFMVDDDPGFVSTRIFGPVHRGP